jgi:hypothetical protein
MLENEFKVERFELDKYKLLINENDVINNLLLKLCNKLANTFNSLSILKLKSSCDQNDQEESIINNGDEMNTNFKEEIVIEIDFIK